MVYMSTIVKIFELEILIHVFHKKANMFSGKGNFKWPTHEYSIKSTFTWLSNEHVLLFWSGVVCLKPEKYNVGVSNQIVFWLCNFTGDVNFCLIYLLQ